MEPVLAAKNRRWANRNDCSVQPSRTRYTSISATGVRVTRQNADSKPSLTKKERKSRHNLNSAASIRLMSMSPQPRDGSQKSCWRFSRCLNRHGRANRNPHSAVIQSNYPVWSVLKTSRNAEMKKTRTGKDRSAEALAHALYVTFAVGKQVIMP
jgi:hypothetical protein